MTTFFEPGFFTNGPVHTALMLGAIVSVVSAVVGVLTVIRSQSFAGHALTDVATTGGSGSTLISAPPLLGFIVGAVVGSLAMESIGVQRAQRRDVATGIVLGAATGLSALFLYLDATRSANTGVTQQVLFGSIFTVSSSTIPVTALLGILLLTTLALCWRMLVLSSISEDIASAGGARVRVLGLLFMTALAVAVGLSAIVIGSILSTALLIGPAATALRLTKSLFHAVALSALIGVGATWLGILFSYDSYYWDSSSQGLPVSFFIVVIVVVVYLFALVPVRNRHKQSSKTRAA